MLSLNCGSGNILSFYQERSKSCGSFNFRACNCCRCLRCIMSFSWANFWLQPLDGSMPAHVHLVLLCFTSGVLLASLDLALQGFSDDWQAWEQGLMMLSQPSTRGSRNHLSVPMIQFWEIFCLLRKDLVPTVVTLISQLDRGLSSFSYLLLSSLLHFCFLGSPVR